MRLSRIFGCIALAAVGCDSSGSASSKPLTCEWLAGADNCWLTTTFDFDDCQPFGSDTWILYGDNSGCIYPDGTATVTFTPPLALPIPDNATWNFTFEYPTGTTCMHFEDDGRTMTLTAGTKTVTVTRMGTSGMAIACPNGSRVQAADTSDLLSCPDLAGLDVLPKLIWSSSAEPASVSVALGGGGGHLFTCSR